FGAVNVFSYTSEYFLNLFIQFGAISDDEDTAVIHVFQYPFGQPYHRGAFATTLCMPENTTFSSFDKLLCGSYTHVLVRPTNLLDASVKYDILVHKLQEAFPVAELYQVLVQRQVNGFGQGINLRISEMMIDWIFFLFPLEIILGRGFYGAVAQAFGIIA